MILERRGSIQTSGLSLFAEDVMYKNAEGCVMNPTIANEVPIHGVIESIPGGCILCQLWQNYINVVLLINHLSLESLPKFSHRYYEIIYQEEISTHLPAGVGGGG